jgi:hypothetical protein
MTDAHRTNNSLNQKQRMLDEINVDQLLATTTTNHFEISPQSSKGIYKRISSIKSCRTEEKLGSLNSVGSCSNKSLNSQTVGAALKDST